MSLEIERRWLPKNDSWREHIKGLDFVDITQGYLAIDDNRNVYVQVANSKSVVRSNLYIRIREKDSRVEEHRFQLKYSKGQKLLSKSKYLLEKRRWFLVIDGLKYAIDEFRGRHRSLVLIELELEHKDIIVRPPPWVGREVTEVHYYSNTHLATSGLPDRRKREEVP